MTDEELRQLAEECKTLGDELVPGGEGRGDARVKAALGGFVTPWRWREAV